MTGTPTHRAWLWERVFCGLTALLFTFMALRFFRNLRHDPAGGLMVYGVPILASATVALLCWWFALRGHHDESREVMRMGCLGGFAVGGIGFLAGFIGPLVVAPDAAQGPLLGILITGPLGFVAGTVCGVIFGVLKRRKGRSFDNGLTGE